MKQRFYVIGSINIDLSLTVEAFPSAGETISGKSFTLAFGGKGANQAVALSRLCDMHQGIIFLAGKTGMDEYGKGYRKYLRKSRINTQFLGKSQKPTGTALIEIDKTGANRIVVVAGANGDINNHWWYGIRKKIRLNQDSICLFQLEIPVLIVEKAIQDVQQTNGMVILDPAPACQLETKTWRSVDYITPNQTETAFYTGIYPKTDTDAQIAAQWFFKKGVKNVIIKAGANGSWLFSVTSSGSTSCEGNWHCPAFPVEVIDTTAAGDSFNAGFAYALSCGMPRQNALRFANAVGGLSTTKKGAQNSMPDRNTVEALLQAWPKIVPRRL